LGGDWKDCSSRTAQAKKLPRLSSTDKPGVVVMSIISAVQEAQVRGFKANPRKKHETLSER
jgi:hypothetical protein